MFQGAFQEFHVGFQGFQGFYVGFQRFKAGFQKFLVSFHGLLQFQGFQGFQAGFRRFLVGFQDVCTPDFKSSWPLERCPFLQLIFSTGVQQRQGVCTTPLLFSLKKIVNFSSAHPRKSLHRRLVQRITSVTISIGLTIKSGRAVLERGFKCMITSSSSRCASPKDFYLVTSYSINPWPTRTPIHRNQNIQDEREKPVGVDESNTVD